MFKKYLFIFLKYFVPFTFGFYFLWLGLGLIFYRNAPALMVISIIYVFLISYLANKELTEKYREEINKISNEIELTKKETKLWKDTLIERTSGFPTLLTFIKEYKKLKDEKIQNYLKSKKHPAIKASDVVKEETIRRREAEYENKKTQAIINYYEWIAPFLVDFKNDLIDIKEEENLKEYDEEELQDPTVNYLTKEEFRKLSSQERNQLALDRFWKRPKSNWLLGRIYERYIGYLYEEQGYNVEYVGIFKGYEDLGRDLICRKGKNFIIIQCKNWSQFKTIYEKHIFQFFGTVFQYKDANPEHIVRGIFYTTTSLSDLARKFSQELGQQCPNV